MNQDQRKTSEVQIGDGATFTIGSDRYPYTVVGILTAKRLQVRRDHAVRTDKNGFSEIQTWEYSPDENAPSEVITLRKNGRWYRLGEPGKGSGFFTIGKRSMYQDPSF
jgi:hypothetical protein